MLSPIQTIILPDIPIASRESFLFVVKKYVVEFALKKQELFLAMGLDAQYFHKDDESADKTPIVLIHSLQINGFLTLRAYTQKGKDTLLFWYQLFQKEHPEYCVNVIQSQETFDYKKISHPIYYSSDNWIPFRDLKQEKGVYIDKDTDTKVDKENFETRVKGNLLTFIGNIGLDTKNIRFELSQFKISPKHNSIIALQTKEKGKLLNIKKYAFKVSFGIDVQLPYYFSLGQNVSYANGLFIRKKRPPKRN